MAITSTLVREIPVCADCVAVIVTYADDGTGAADTIVTSKYLGKVDVAIPMTSASAASTLIVPNVNGIGASLGDILVTTAMSQTGAILIIGSPKRHL